MFWCPLSRCSFIPILNLCNEGGKYPLSWTYVAYYKCCEKIHLIIYLNHYNRHDTIRWIILQTHCTYKLLIFFMYSFYFVNIIQKQILLYSPLNTYHFCYTRRIMMDIYYVWKYWTCRKCMNMFAACVLYLWIIVDLLKLLPGGGGYFTILGSI